MSRNKEVRGRALLRLVLLSSTVLFAAPAWTGAAFAQSGQPAAQQERGGDIIVTARKREETLFETPAAITALSAEAAADLNISNVDDVGKYVPNLNITRFGVGNTAQAAIFIRGIGLQDHIITTDPGVGVYLDGVYLGRQLGSNLSLINIERVEVLRGPQGTLYGRNSLGGAVNIITKDPGSGSDGAIVNLQGGSRGRAAANLYSEFDLFENFSVGVSAYFKRRNGVGEFLLLPEPEADVGEEQEFGGRIKATWDVNEKLSFTFSIDGLQANGGQSPYFAEVNGLVPGGGAFQFDQFTPGVTPIDAIFASSGTIQNPFNPNSRTDPGNGDFAVLQPGFQGDISAFLPPGANGQLFAPDRDDSFSTVAGLDTTSNAAWGGSLTADYAITESLSTRVLASYRFSDYSGGLDDDDSPFNLSEFPEIGQAEQISVEWQFNANIGIVDFVGGFFYFREEGFTESGPFIFSPFNIVNGQDNFGVPATFGIELEDGTILPGLFTNDFGDFDLNQTTNAFAGYGNVKLNLTEKFTLGGGLRWSSDSKDADALFPSFGGTRDFESATFQELTWDVNALYNLSSDWNVYAQIQKGYQTGGFPPRPFGGAASFESFDETTAINYETGIKGGFGDWLNLALTGFWTQYRDLALPFSDTTAGGGFVTIVENAGRSRARGVELESVLRPFAGFSLATNVGFLDAEITEVEPGTVGIGLGDTPALTPRWTLAVIPRYETELANGGRISAQLDYSFRSQAFGQSVNLASEILESRGLVGFNIEYLSPDQSWSFGVYGENITNEVYSVGRLQQTGFVGVVLSNDRSEFGVRLSKRFGSLAPS